MLQGRGSVDCVCGIGGGVWESRGGKCMYGGLKGGGAFPLYCSRGQRGEDTVMGAYSLTVDCIR